MVSGIIGNPTSAIVLHASRSPRLPSTTLPSRTSAVLTPECEHVPQDWRRTSNKIIMTRIFRTINQVFTKIAGDNALVKPPPNILYSHFFISPKKIIPFHIARQFCTQLDAYGIDIGPFCKLIIGVNGHKDTTFF
jgi:hypothetical protein